jgi:CxxC motif-containing protein
MKKELICISCPVGCRITLEWDNTEISSLEGNQCKKGEEYAREELFSPKRIVTTTCNTNSDLRLPVRTTKPLDIALIDPLLKKLHSLNLKIPIDLGEIIIKNYKKTGIDVISSLTLE